MEIARWLMTSRESTNYTYELTATSQARLCSFVAQTLGVEARLASETITELRDDAALAAHIAEVTRRSAFRRVSDPVARYGRRAGWYAFVRLTRPRLVVESGLDKGLGACVLAAALLRNAEEGDPGRYLGLDIDPSAGWLLTGRYAEVATIEYGDSITSLRRLVETVDLFIHDSNHEPMYERAEYLAVSPKLSEPAVIVSDNAHATDELERFAIATSRSFDFWREEPDHWYPGGGIGVAWHPELAGRMNRRMRLPLVPDEA